MQEEARTLQDLSKFALADMRFSRALFRKYVIYITGVSEVTIPALVDIRYQSFDFGGWPTNGHGDRG